MRTGRRLLLFDIDGTLLRAGSHAVDAYADAFRSVIGKPFSIRSVDCAGRTDGYIVTGVLRRFGYPHDQELVGRIQSAFIDAFRARIESGITLQAIDHVRPALEYLSAKKDICLWLLTGNLEEVARLKLRGAGLEGFFPGGAYGSDHHERNPLALLAARRAEQTCGHDFPAERVYVIGDSVHDIRAARHAGYHAVAVSTGTTEPQILKMENPENLLPDLRLEHIKALFG